MRIATCGLILVGFVISVFATAAIRAIALKINFVDKPGQRKIHDNPKALGGGIAIFLSVVLPMVAGLLILHFSNIPGGQPGAIRTSIAQHQAGVRFHTPLAISLLVAITAMHLLGLWDDRKALGPTFKLIAQLVITTALVVGFDLRALTILGYVPSIVLSVLWIVGITNAFNFLDNMDGLTAGVAAISAAAFLATTLLMPQPQWFVAAVLALLIGGLLGFLIFNFNPATIFMGDSGSLVVGFVLGVLTIRTTYIPVGTKALAAGWYPVLAPLIVLAVPLYDLTVVSMIRMARGKSIFVGDTNHLSHRLVARGMSRRTAVLCIYLMTAATSVAAILLTHVESTLGAMLIFGQTVLVLFLVALLERHPLPPIHEETPSISK